MADEGGEKTELPTPKKLRDARKKGQVCMSKDVSSAAMIVVMLGISGAIGISMTMELGDLIRFIGQRTGTREIDCNGAAIQSIIIILKYSLLFSCVAAFVGVAATMTQIGLLFSADPIKPELNKLNPVQGFKRIFCMKNFFEFLKNVVKVSFLGYIIYKLIWNSIPLLLPMCYGTINDVLPILKELLIQMAKYTAFGYIVIAIIDFIFQQKNFTKQMMMSKDEVKREYKEMEGSQEIKQAQRQFRHEILNGPNPRQATKKANVIITNPTHLAIGIRYNTDEAPLPKVVISGADLIAKIIRETAMETGIPIIEDVPLARALYFQVKVEEYIPVELVEPVAEILKMVQSLENARREQDELDSVILD